LDIPAGTALRFEPGQSLATLQQAWPDPVLHRLAEMLREHSVQPALSVIPLGQTDGQPAIVELEESVLAASAQAENATIDDLGSAAFMVDLASMAHETQYTRLFRS
jgi:urease accessory protein UreF